MTDAADTGTLVPTLTTVDETAATLTELAKTNEWVSVFWDRGWGDSGQTAEITIIVDGNGQQPKAHITADVYRALLDAGTIHPNSLNTFKARRLHDYKTPPPAPEPAVNPAKVAETVIRNVMDGMPDTPVVARFHRGIRQGTFGPRIVEETVRTPAAGTSAGWYALLLPGVTDVAMSAIKPDILGPDIIGGGIASCLDYPTSGDSVDVDALTGVEFRTRLLAAINEKAAIVAAEFEKTNTKTA